MDGAVKRDCRRSLYKGDDAMKWAELKQQLASIDQDEDQAIVDLAKFANARLVTDAEVNAAIDEDRVIALRDRVVDRQESR